jgi:hypothetical protein
MKRCLLAIFLAGCSHGAPATTWLDQVRGAHARADAALARGDLDGGRAALRELIDAAVPSRITLEDRRLVLQDALYRLAEIELGEMHPQAALAWADRGLALGGRDVFYANLLVARGHAREDLGEDTWAAADYHDALVINDELLQKALPR